MIYDTLKKLRVEEEIRKHPPMRIYKDEKTGQIVEQPLMFDSAASALIHRTMKQYNQAREIHKAMFGS